MIVLPCWNGALSFLFLMIMITARMNITARKRITFGDNRCIAEWNVTATFYDNKILFAGNVTNFPHRVFGLLFAVIAFSRYLSIVEISAEECMHKHGCTSMLNIYFNVSHFYRYVEEWRHGRREAELHTKGVPGYQWVLIL
ncbi:hypothetical protein T4E_10487 [Trichinella pseudospiralis]|uniref:Uncharacterized protein n=1 Tax=Trichinella pseudospiralis TaxID=6337 RepID=A0A0V0XNU6_TRIPS|nr:hypothetical protein T4E_10487 [Trichinella pseudospiralis]